MSHFLRFSAVNAIDSNGFIHRTNCTNYRRKEISRYVVILKQSISEWVKNKVCPVRVEKKKKCPIRVHLWCGDLVTI